MCLLAEFIIVNYDTYTIANWLLSGVVYTILQIYFELPIDLFILKNNIYTWEMLSFLCHDSDSNE